ncbi:MAG: sensor histidine kinase [Alcanivorax sp.]
MMDSTKSKLSTESDTATKKTSRWFRIGTHRGDIDQLFDLYWGGKERRITNLTLRIMGVNALAVITLILGVVYLSQYHMTLIASRLEHFETELTLVTAAITEGALIEDNTEDEDASLASLHTNKAEILSARLGATLNKRVMVFDVRGDLVADSELLIEKYKVQPIFQVVREEKRKLESVEVLKEMASWIVAFFPEHDTLPLFEGVTSDKAIDYHDAIEAYDKKLNMTAWRNVSGELMLTASMPILNDNREVNGVVMMISDGTDIKEALGDAWFNILKVFLATLIITVLLSIYLSGVIARPLRKLASAAENVRKGKLKHTEIPDMSDRNDEIGELSIVLRDMTHALWDRMDTIEAFAADVSHEIKNPLTSLKSAVETAGIVKKKEDLQRLLDIIKHDIERLDRLISDISNASRLDAELSREAFGIINFKTLLRNLLDSYKSPLEREMENRYNSDEALKNGILITLDMPDHVDIYVRGSEGRLIQVFQNIIANALSFAPVKSTIKVLVTLKGNRVSVAIEDEGPGIPENQLDNVFKRFYSERPEHEKYGQHSGLGLSICKQIITAHNGIIYAENNVERDGEASGARFVVLLNVVSKD